MPTPPAPSRAADPTLPSASDIVTFARLDGEPAAGAGEDTAPEAAAARARRTTLFCVFINLLVQNF